MKQTYSVKNMQCMNMKLTQGIDQIFWIIQWCLFIIQPESFNNQFWFIQFSVQQLSVFLHIYQMSGRLTVGLPWVHNTCDLLFTNIGLSQFFCLENCWLGYKSLIGVCIYCIIYTCIYIHVYMCIHILYCTGPMFTWLIKCKQQRM